MIIYKITNKLNGDCYIGQTVRTLLERWVEHCKPASECFYLQNAIQKYGKENFSIETIASYSTMEDLNNAEEYFIDYYNCLRPNGYNLTTGGFNRILSEESRKKISDAQRGEKNHRFGKHISEENSKKMSEIHRGNKYNLGRKASDETKYKMSEVRKGKKMPPFSEEHKSNLSKSLKGRNPSHSTKIICLETGIIYNSITEAAKKLNLDKSNISKVIRGKANTSGKLTFKVGE